MTCVNYTYLNTLIQEGQSLYLFVYDQPKEILTEIQYFFHDYRY